MASVYLALGSNLGNRRANLRMALRGLTRMCRVEAVSSLYESKPVGPEQPRYFNAVCRAETGLEPVSLLRFVKALEEEIGRRPSAERWAPRVIDIDILLYEDQAIESEELTLPHPRLLERAFVLVPLAEIGGDDPQQGLGAGLRDLAAQVDQAGLIKVQSIGWDGVAGVETEVRL